MRCASIIHMSEFYDSEIDRLHHQLAEVYRRGALTSAEEVQVKGLWARIERLEATRAKIVVREAKRAIDEGTISGRAGADDSAAGVFGTNRGGRG